MAVVSTYELTTLTITMGEILVEKITGLDGCVGKGEGRTFPTLD